LFSPRKSKRIFQVIILGQRPLIFGYWALLIHKSFYTLVEVEITIVKIKKIAVKPQVILVIFSSEVRVLPKI
jgi:hypothetical protein